MMTKTAVVLLAPGAEELETVTIVDVLVRGGVDVTLAGVNGPDVVECSRKVLVKPHKALAAIAADAVFDAVVVPGGLGGATTCAESKEVGALLQRHDKAGKIVAAICAGPLALKAHNIGHGKSATCFPALKERFEGAFTFKAEPVVQDGQMVTSQCPGTAMAFGLKLVELLSGAEKMAAVEKGLHGR